MPPVPAQPPIGQAPQVVGEVFSYEVLAGKIVAFCLVLLLVWHWRRKGKI